MTNITLRSVKGSPLTNAEVDSNFSSLNDYKVEQTDSTGSALIPSGTTAQRDGSPSAGMFRYNSDLGQFEGYTTVWGEIGGSGDSYISNTYVYTASASQTTFTGADDNAATLSYTAGNIQVFLNGVNLIDTVDYTATNETSVVLTTAAAASDVLVVNAFNTAVTDITNADLLDSQQGTYYLDYNNFTNTPTNVSAFTNDANYLDSNTVTGFNVSAFTNDANYLDSNTVTGVIAAASVSEYRSKTASKYVTPQVAFNAMEQIQLTDATTIAVDLSSGFNFKVTLSGSNAATFNFTNGYAGQTGRIRIDYGDSSNTATFQSEGGTGTVYNSPTLSTDSASLDIIYYDCIDSNEIYLTANLGVT